MYLAIQKQRGGALMTGNAWKWAFGLLNGGLLGMVGALLVSGMAQTFYERAIGGSTFSAYVSAQATPWFMEGMYMREVFGVLFAAGYVVLAWDLLTIGRRVSVTEPEPAAEGTATVPSV
jgi:nitric oxide reductase subunit B